MAGQKQDFVTEITGDFNALEKLFQSGQMVQEAERRLDDAKLEYKAAKEYNDRLVAHIADYTTFRKVERAEQMALGQMFEEMPPWLSSKNPDGRGDDDEKE
jgi:hypothetical protein